MNSYEQWLTNNNCCCNGASTITPDCGKDCSCEAIYLEINNLKTDVNVVSGEVENKLDASAYTPVSLDGYATEQWVEDKGYLTEVDLSDYALIEDIPTEVSELNNDAGYINQLKTINGESLIGEGNIIISGGSGATITVDDHMDSASTNPVENKVITDALNDKLDASAYTPVSLSGYATEQWVLDKHYISGVDLSDYALKSEIPTVPTSNSAFTNDMHYLTSADTANYITSGTAQTLINNAFYCCSEAEWSQISGNPQENVLYLIY